jgi:hypothetical protein
LYGCIVEVITGEVFPDEVITGEVITGEVITDEVITDEVIPLLNRSKSEVITFCVWMLHNVE